MSKNRKKEKNEKREAKENRRVKKTGFGCLTKILVFFAAIFVFLFIIESLSSDDSASIKQADTSVSSEVSSPVSGSSEPPSPNTSAMVDYIASEARKSANHSSSPEKRDEAIEYLYSQYPDYFSDNETMEKVMYYGYYLEYAYSKNGATNVYANLGIDAYQCVKYVYRNTDAIDSVHVQENLSQIQDAFTELGYLVE